MPAPADARLTDDPTGGPAPAADATAIAAPQGRGGRADEGKQERRSAPESTAATG